MAIGGLDSFLRAEEEANQLVQVLKGLKEEAESYQTAREALDEAAKSVSELSSRCAAVAEQLGAVAKTLQSIGTPELLQRLEAVAKEVEALRQNLDHTRGLVERLEAVPKEVEALRQNLDDTREWVRTVRNLAFGSVGLIILALAVLGWLAVVTARS